MSDNLIPRQPKRKRQPTAECMREQLALAADRIIELETVIATVRHLMGWDREPKPSRPWYRRIFRRAA